MLRFCSLATVVFACLGILGVTALNTVVLFDGLIELYSASYYQDPLLTMNISYPNRCYNLACDYLDGKIASAKWSGLPTSGIAGKAYIGFYSDLGCKGSKAVMRLPNNGGVREFVIPQVKTNITSFMVLGESRNSKWHGMRNVCSWKGSNVTGGIVFENEQ